MEKKTEISYISVFSENKVELAVTNESGILKVTVPVNRESLLQLVNDFIDGTYTITINECDPDYIPKTRIYIAKGKK